jgi:diguanylate cyclase (GGDEF)-like protein
MGTREDDGKPPLHERLAEICSDIRLLSLLPALTVAGYWLQADAVLLVVSALFPALLALQEAARRARPAKPPAPAEPDEDRDALTGACTRREALKRLGQFVAVRKSTGRVTAVILVDLDQFRQVNERFGLAVGDEVLRTAAERIESGVRDVDIVARTDGDSFAVILAPVRHADYESILTIAERIQAAIAEPVTLDRLTVYLSASVGMCLAGRAPENTALSMLQSAEVALEEARAQGGGAVRSFSPKMRRESHRYRVLSTELEAALENGQIRPWFQPQVCTDTGEVAGFEALARWEHPGEGLIGPGDFLKAVENAGRSERLSEVILYHSLSALRAWDKSGFRIPNVGVNFSTDELRNPRLCEKIKWEVDRFDLAPERITIEILETVIAAGEDDVITRNLRGLTAMGFGMDLDDFGTGHASIQNIHRFGVDRIKIDRSFVRHVDEDRDRQVMIAAIVGMADNLGIDALAEGVENGAEQSMLAQLGCRYVQGYGLARPMPFDDTVSWLHKHNAKLAGGPALDSRAG